MASHPPIPFNRPVPSGNELAYIGEALAGRHLSGDGPFTRRCHALLEEILNGSRALLTTSCTHALELAALLLDIGPGDEVVVPSFTFVSTANAFVLRGARPVFCDIRPDTLGLDERKLESLVTSRTRAVVAVHYAGVACEMDPILELARQRNLAVVEDNAHGLFGRYRGRALGTLGVLSTLSFHETKNVFCGEGGALVLNDPGPLCRAEILREKGTDRSRFFRGEIDRYGWVDVGSSYLPSEILAAFLLAQIEARDAIQSRRRLLWERYQEGLLDWAKARGTTLPVIPPHCEIPYHIFYVLLPSAEERTQFLSHLKSRGIHAVFHYLPLHVSPMGRRFGGLLGDCPVAEDVSERLARLPLYPSLTDDEAERVIDAVRAF